MKLVGAAVGVVLDARYVAAVKTSACLSASSFFLVCYCPFQENRDRVDISELFDSDYAVQ